MSNTEGFLMYASMVENFRSLKQTNPEWALEYISALIDYSFDGIVYEGDNVAIKLALNSEMVMIDNQRVRYGKASKGGNAQKVSDEQILEAFKNNDFKNITDAARYIATNYADDGKFTRQSLSYRLQKMGISFEELSSQNFSNQKTQISCENPQIVCANADANADVNADAREMQTQTQVNNPTLTPTLTSTHTSTLTDNDYSLAQSATVVNEIRKSYKIYTDSWGLRDNDAKQKIMNEYHISSAELERILGESATAINKQTKEEKKNPLDGLL